MRTFVLIVCAALFGGMLSAGCDLKVPITDVGAEFKIADATWFEEEETLFIFYRIDSLQGLSPFSQIELEYRTDTIAQEYIDIVTLPSVHNHVQADCGPRTLCGSYSIAVPDIPRQVRLRLRYHREGETFLDSPLTYNVVGTGPAHTNRSAIVYGVTDESNTRVQWRLRHQFPEIRNPLAQTLGLRRFFSVTTPSIGGIALDPQNPYAYGIADVCPASFEGLGFEEVATDDRARFASETLPIEFSDRPQVCAQSTVTDAVGTFETVAFTQRNPEVESAFGAIRTPVRENRILRFLLQFCDEPRPDNEHRDMQMQRLSLAEDDIYCVDEFRQAGFAGEFTTFLKGRIDELRAELELAAGEEDMVLVFAVHRETGIVGLAERIEQALAPIVREEADKSTPRLTGAFVYDSFAHQIRDEDVARFVLWCPASIAGIDLELIDNASTRTCPTQLLPPPITLGPAQLTTFPIMATRPQYENFIEDFGVRNAGRVTDFKIVAPTRTPLSRNVPVGDFGLATFFNNEAITPDAGDAFSYCAENDTFNVVFTVPGFNEVGPLSVLGEVHSQFAFESYELGLAWDFPFFLTLEYQSFLAFNGTAFGVTIPFGIGSPAEEFRGSFVWEQESFDISRALKQCRRFCDAPTFDSAGVYNVRQRFRETYAAQCYAPLFPTPPGSAFPVDP